MWASIGGVFCWFVRFWMIFNAKPYIFFHFWIFFWIPQSLDPCKNRIVPTRAGDQQPGRWGTRICPFGAAAARTRPYRAEGGPLEPGRMKNPQFLDEKEIGLSDLS